MCRLDQHPAVGGASLRGPARSKDTDNIIKVILLGSNDSLKEKIVWLVSDLDSCRPELEPSSVDNSNTSSLAKMISSNDSLNESSTLPHSENPPEGPPSPETSMEFLGSSLEIVSGGCIHDRPVSMLTSQGRITGKVVTSSMSVLVTSVPDAFSREWLKTQESNYDIAVLLFDPSEDLEDYSKCLSIEELLPKDLPRIFVSSRTDEGEHENEVDAAAQVHLKTHDLPELLKLRGISESQVQDLLNSLLGVCVDEPWRHPREKSSSTTSAIRASDDDCIAFCHRNRSARTHSCL